MSGGTRPVTITFLCCAATAAMRAGRFPKPDDALDAATETRLKRLSFRPGRLHRVQTSRAGSAIATADALGLAAVPDPLLDEGHAGRWAGLSIDDLATSDPVALAAWLDAPQRGAPEGQAFAAVLARVSRWLDAQRDGPGVVAVTHAAVIRAAVLLALGVPGAAPQTIDIAPLSLTGLSGSPGHWRLTRLGVPLRPSR